MEHPGQIAAAGDAARRVLEEKHAAREITLSASRRAIRSCASAIRAVHRREFGEARALIAEAAAYLAEARAGATVVNNLARQIIATNGALPAAAPTPAAAPAPAAPTTPTGR